MGVLIIRILLFRVPYQGPLFSDSPICLRGGGAHRQDQEPLGVQAEAKAILQQRLLVVVALRFLSC